MKDNYKEAEWDFEATHVRKRGDLSLFETICKDIRACRLEGVDFHAGLYYNKTNKEKFKDDAPGVLDSLNDLVEEAQDLTPRLLKAMTATKQKPNADHKLMHQYVQTAGTPNVTEWVGILSWGLQLRFSNEKQCVMAVDCVRFIERHNLQGLHKTAFKLMKGWIADVLVHAYSSHRPRMPPTKFLESVYKLWPLVLPKDEVEKIKDLDKDAVKAHGETVQCVVQASPLGSALFAPLFRDIAAEIYEKDLEKELDKILPTNKKITEESVLIAKASLLAFAEAHELLGNVSACRMATD